MSLKLEELTTVLNESGLPQEEIDKLLGSAKSFYEFNDYIKEKLELSEEAVELLVELKIKSAVASLDLDTLESEEELLDFVSGTLADFAADNGYDKADQLKEDAKVIMKLSM